MFLHLAALLPPQVDNALRIHSSQYPNSSCLVAFSSCEHLLSQVVQFLRGTNFLHSFPSLTGFVLPSPDGSAQSEIPPLLL